MSRGRALGLGAALLVAAGVAGGYVASISTRGGESAYYDLSPVGIVAVFVAALAAALGGALVLVHRRWQVALLGLVGTYLVAFGVLAIFSIGLALIAAGLLVLLAMGLGLSRDDSREGALSALGGATLALGLVVLTLAFREPPVVACGPGGGVSTSTPLWWGAGSSSGSATGSSDGRTTTGSVRAGETTISFRCEDGRLVELRRE